MLNFYRRNGKFQNPHLIFRNIILKVQMIILGKVIGVSDQEPRLR